MKVKTKKNSKLVVPSEHIEPDFIKAFLQEASKVNDLEKIKSALRLSGADECGRAINAIYQEELRILSALANAVIEYFKVKKDINM